MSQDTAKVLQRTPGPDGRSWSHAQAGFKGVEGEIAHDPVTPGVVWAGGVQGGSRINGERNCADPNFRVGRMNGGDVAKAPGNMEFRACSLQAIKASYANLEKTSGVPLSHLFAKSLNRAPVSRLDPNWKDPVEEVGGDVRRMRDLTFHDLQQMNLRYTNSDVLCSAPAKWGEATIMMELLMSPWTFPFCSSVFPNCPSSRKLYYLVLSDDFAFTIPGLPGRTMGKEEFFGFVFEVLLPAFPDFTFNAALLTTTGLDDLCHLQIQATGTHTGAPFSVCGLPAIPASGKRVGLSIDFLRAKIVDLRLVTLGTDTPEDPQCFPTGIYLQLGGTLPGF